MNKQEFAARLAKNGNYSKGLAKKIVDDFTYTIIDCLVDGEEIQIYNFGKFATKTIPAHIINDFQNPGQTTMCRESICPSFIAYDNFKNYLCTGIKPERKSDHKVKSRRYDGKIDGRDLRGSNKR